MTYRNKYDVDFHVQDPTEIADGGIQGSFAAKLPDLNGLGKFRGGTLGLSENFSLTPKLANRICQKQNYRRGKRITSPGPGFLRGSRNEYPFKQNHYTLRRGRKCNRLFAILFNNNLEKNMHAISEYDECILENDSANSVAIECSGSTGHETQSNSCMDFSELCPLGYSKGSS